MKPHVIGQGESVVTLAARHGFDLDVVWNHKKNDRLRAQRGDPHVLASGDVLYIPDPDMEWFPVAVGGANQFVVTIPKLHVSIGCTGPDGPIAGKDYFLDGIEPEVKGTTDGDGVATFSFPSNLSTVHVHFPDIKFVFVAKIAHLDPITVPSGVEQRLVAMGLMKPAPPVGTPEAQAIVAAEHLEAAIRVFQKQQGLPETGAVDEATTKALAAAHGV